MQMREVIKWAWSKITRASRAGTCIYTAAPLKILPTPLKLELYVGDYMQ